MKIRRSGDWGVGVGVGEVAAVGLVGVTLTPGVEVGVDVVSAIVGVAVAVTPGVTVGDGVVPAVVGVGDGIGTSALNRARKPSDCPPHAGCTPSTDGKSWEYV
jgi:hypothetical protein